MPRSIRSGRGLTSITIPSSVTTIGSYAFYECSSLETVYVDSSTIYDSLMIDDIGDNLDYGRILEYAQTIYILASIDDGTNTYLSDTTYYPYQYTGVTYNGKVYNVYSQTGIS